MALFVILAALLGLLAILFIGLWTMAQGRSPASSQRWMRYRVLAQGGVLLLLTLSACLLGGDS